jgi:small neutral amino acid transporter SnatA (MarC family)
MRDRDAAFAGFVSCAGTMAGRKHQAFFLFLFIFFLWAGCVRSFIYSERVSLFIGNKVSNKFIFIFKI